MIVLLLVSCSNATDEPAEATAEATSACALSADDQAWLDRAMDAWHYSVNNISEIGNVTLLDAVVFDDDCLLMSSDAR